MVNMENLTGKELGQYRIVAPFGEGGMASVYKAFQPGTERYVALKILPQHYANEATFHERFQQEAQIIAKFQHPHILPVFDYGEQDNFAYLVMPLIEGGTLAKLINGGTLELSQVRTIISQIGDALDYAHSYGVVHRDVKPTNILIDERQNALLTDFGISKIIGDMINLTGTGQIIGTPAYMSPEQIKGELIDGRSDIYSLGIVLYEMVTGRTPYRADTPPALYVKHLLDPLPPPSTIIPDLPEPVEKVILKSLAKDPNDRYQTAAEMVQAIKRAIGVGPRATVAAVPAITPDPPLRPDQITGKTTVEFKELAPAEQNGFKAVLKNRRIIVAFAILMIAIIAAFFLTRLDLRPGPNPISEDIPEKPPAAGEDAENIAVENETESQPPGSITNLQAADAAEEVSLSFVESEQALGEEVLNAIALADLDGDNDLDAMLNNQVWINDGSGEFKQMNEGLDPDPDTKEIALSDVDGDQDFDLITAAHGPNEIWLNDGRAKFINSGQNLGDGLSWALAVGDVDDDQDIDILFTVEDGHELYINDGLGQFTASDQDFGNGGVRGVALQDVDGDSDLDAYFADCNLYLNNGAGNFSLSDNNPCDLIDPVTLAMGDIDGDDDIDAVIGNAGTNANVVLINDGRGRFSDSGQALGASATEQVVLTDLDQDGDIDLFSANTAEAGSNLVDKVWLNNGQGIFSDSSLALGSVDSFGAVAGDVNGDLLTDILIGAGYAPNLIYFNTTPVESAAVDNNLVGYWNFDEGIGPMAADSAPADNNNDGQLIGDPAWVAGVSGSALHLEPALNQSIEIPNKEESLSIPSGAVTISAWIKPAIVEGEHAIVAKDKKNSSGRGNYFFALNFGHLQFGFQPLPLGSDVWIDTAEPILEPNQWAHTAVSFTYGSGEKPKIYVNGVEIPLGEWQGSGDQANLPFTHTTPFYIGSNEENGIFFGGIIDEVKIYDRVLTPEEIAAQSSLN